MVVIFIPVERKDYLYSHSFVNNSLNYLPTIEACVYIARIIIISQ